MCMGGGSCFNWSWWWGWTRRLAVECMSRELNWVSRRDELIFCLSSTPWYKLNILDAKVQEVFSPLPPSFGCSFHCSLNPRPGKWITRFGLSSGHSNFVPIWVRFGFGLIEFGSGLGWVNFEWTKFGLGLVLDQLKFESGEFWMKFTRVGLGMGRVKVGFGWFWL